MIALSCEENNKKANLSDRGHDPNPLQNSPKIDYPHLSL